jgi:hypothetical protein
MEGCFSSLACSQIWLNLHVDHHHFGCITKLTPKFFLFLKNKFKNQKKVNHDVYLFIYLVFLFWANFVMQPKWQRSTPRFSQI